jgi:hypothetical protein
MGFEVLASAVAYLDPPLLVQAWNEAALPDPLIVMLVRLLRERNRALPFAVDCARNFALEAREFRDSSFSSDWGEAEKR